jgi:hypothetical protein
MMDESQKRQRQREEEELLSEVRTTLSQIPLPSLSVELGPMPSHGWRDAVVRNRSASSPMDLLGWAVAPDKLEALIAVVRPLLSDSDLAMLARDAPTSSQADATG